MGQITTQGNLTIIDTTDIESIVVEYARNQSTSNPPTSGWSTNRPAWAQGYYIWQRTRIHKAGTDASTDTYGTAVCLTGSTGQTGATGAAGRSLTNMVTQYTTAASSATITESNMGQYTWTTNVPSYSSSTPVYWVRVTNTYSNPSSTEYIIYKDNGITDSIYNAAVANSIAQHAQEDADGALGQASVSIKEIYRVWYRTNSDTTPAKPSAHVTQTGNDVTNTWTKTKPIDNANNRYYFYCDETITNGGISSWTEPVLDTSNLSQYEVGALSAKMKNFWWDSDGAHAASGISGASVTEGTASTYGYNSLMGVTGFNIGYNAAKVIDLKTTPSPTSLDMYQPPSISGSTVTQGAKTISLSGNALTFYNPSTGNAQMVIGANGTLQSGNYVYTSGTYSDSGTKIDLTTGSIYTPGFRTDGSNTYIRGEINALSGKIGNNSTNYWTIGNNYNYDQTASAALISHGTAFIQLDTSNTWRLSTDRIHTAWNGTDSSAALMFPKDGNTYWDWGIHSPHQTNNVWKDKFVYARKYINTTDDDFTNRDNLSNDIDDDLGFWKYQFYIDKNGSIYARNFYLLNEDGTPGSNIGGQDSVYLLKSGGIITGNLEVNGTLTKGNKNVAYLTATPTTNQVLIADGTTGGIKTSGYTIAKSVPSGAIFTDENVKSTEANTTKLWLVGSDTSGTRTGALKYDSGVYITTTAGALHATTFEGNLSGTATRATADSDGNTIKTTYLKLSGGNVTGAVTFGSSVSADELTVGDLVVNGNASFTNNAQFNTINGIAVGSSPKFTDTNYYHTTGSWGGTNNLTYTATANGGAGALAFTLATATTGVYGVTKLSNATDSTSTTLAATASAVKAAYDLAASKTDNTGTVTSVRVQASSPLQSSSSTASSTTLSTTISFTNQNVNTILAGPSSGTTAAAPTFRKLVAADIPDISGTYYLASNPSGYTTNTGTVTSVRVQASSPLTSTTNTASNTTLDTTIKFSNQNKNLVLAGPSSGNAAAPTFRSLVADDIPSISKSKISDFPTSLKNPNAIRLNLFNETAARAAANQGTATSYVDYDGSTANQSFSAAGKNAITSIGISGDTLSWIRADGSSGSSTVTITASVASGATVLTDTSGNAISTTGNTTPVWFDGGVPKDVTGIAFSLLPTGTGASNVAVGNHTHGNITNDGKITSTATIASGDKLVIVDTDSTAGSKITGSSITFGTSTTTFLSNKGTWETPSAAGSATNATYATYDASEANNTTKVAIADKYIPKSIGTTAGDIIYWSAANTPVRLAKGSNGQVLKLTNGVPAWGTDNNTNYYHTTGSWDGVTYTATANGGAGELKFTLPDASASASGIVNTSAQVLAGKKTIKYTTRIYPLVGISNERSQWYKITFPYYNAETTSAAKWFMNSFDLHFGGGFSSNASGIAHVAFYWTRAANNGAWAASQVAAKLDGILMNKISLYYRIAEPGILYVNNKSNGYNGLWLDNLFVDDTSPTLDWSTTTIETCSAITTTDYTEIPTVRTYNNNNSTYIIGNHTLPMSNNTYNLGSSDNKWANIYATNFNGALNGNATTAGKITDLNSNDNASSTATWRKVWFSYNDNVTGRPALSDKLVFQSSTSTLKASHFLAEHIANGKNEFRVTYGSTIDMAMMVGTGNTNHGLYDNKAEKWMIYADTDGNVTVNGNAATSSKTNAANITTTTNAIAYYTNTAGTFGSKASANGVLYATSANGALNWGTLPIAQGGTGATTAENARTKLGLGTAATASTTTTIASGGTGLPTAGTVYTYVANAINGASNTYVTIATDQTITANQKTFEGAIRWGSASKYGAVNYNSTLDALVFSFA